MRGDIAQESLKSAPPVTVTAWAWANGMTLEKWVALATIVYIALQAGYLIWKWYREWKRGRK